MNTTRTVWRRWGCLCPKCRAGLRNDILHCSNCDHALVLVHERTHFTQESLTVEIPDTQKQFFECPNCTRGFAALICDECEAVVPVRQFTGFSDPDAAPAKKAGLTPLQGCLGCLFWAGVLLLCLRYCHHESPRPPAAASPLPTATATFSPSSTPRPLPAKPTPARAR